MEKLPKSSIYVHLLATIVVFLFGLAGGVMLVQKSPTDSHLDSVYKNIGIDVSEIKKKSPIAESLIDTNDVQVAYALNQNSARLKAVGWTLDGRYMILNIKIDPLDPKMAYVGDYSALIADMKRYKIPKISMEDHKQNKTYHCEILCTDDFGNVVGLNPTTKW